VGVRGRGVIGGSGRRGVRGREITDSGEAGFQAREKKEGGENKKSTIKESPYPFGRFCDVARSS